eukprot:scaffold7349_cov173-Amphora_coffeaeformis.AAC.54
MVHQTRGMCEEGVPRDDRKPHHAWMLQHVVSPTRCTACTYESRLIVKSMGLQLHFHGGEGGRDWDLLPLSEIIRSRIISDPIQLYIRRYRNMTGEMLWIHRLCLPTDPAPN